MNTYFYSLDALLWLEWQAIWVTFGDDISLLIGLRLLMRMWRGRYVMVDAGFLRLGGESCRFEWLRARG